MILSPGTKQVNNEGKPSRYPCQALANLQALPGHLLKIWVPENCLLHLGCSGTPTEFLGLGEVSVSQETGGGGGTAVRRTRVCG